MTNRTRIDAGSGNTAGALLRLCAQGRSVAVYDGRVPGAAVAARSVPNLAAEPCDLSQLGFEVPAWADRLRAARPSRLVAIGGGTTIDAAKLGALACTGDALFDYVRRSATGRAVTVLPGAGPGRAATRGVSVIAVPTTAGTSSEVNDVAVMTNARGHRLVVGAQLRPSHAVLDGETLLSLPVTAMREGAIEAFLRIAGMATGTSRASAMAIELAVALIAAGDDPLDTSRSRLRIAARSAATVGTSTHHPSAAAPNPFAMKHWYVANEVSFGIGVRKMPATAAVVPAIWRRIDAGDRRWGDRDGLRSLWYRVADAAGLPITPAEGILALTRRWGLDHPPRPDDGDIDRVATSTEIAWGRAVPALRGIRRTDVAAVLHDGAWEPRAHIEPDSRVPLALTGRR